MLYDPAGLDRPELIRLAKARSPISGFDPKKLSAEGYQVLVDEKDRQLPSGEIVPDGTEFRNSFHFRVKADLFVPCGGRPEAVNVSNVANLVDGDGKPHFKYVIEGANLFFTQQARLYLEKKGVVLFKDASTNKGGVTSSSLEVLAGLSLKDGEYGELMMVKDGKPSSFCRFLLATPRTRIGAELTSRLELCQRHSAKDLRECRSRVRVHHQRVEPPKGLAPAHAHHRPALICAQRAAK